MSESLTVLSVRQPWASLLLTGEDWCENRSWTTDYRDTLWIHASSHVERGECEIWGIDPQPLVTSAIVGCVELMEILRVGKLRQRQPELIARYGLDANYGPRFVVGPFCWIVAQPKWRATPIPVHGKLRLWKHEVDPQAIADFRPASPLIAHPPRRKRQRKPQEVVPPPPPVRRVFRKLKIRGKEVTVRFTFRQTVEMSFSGICKYRTATGPQDQEYQQGEPYYRAG